MVSFKMTVTFDQLCVLLDFGAENYQPGAKVKMKNYT